MVVVSSWPVETARLKRIPLSACSSAEKAEPEWEIQATFPGSRSARSSKARARNPRSMSANPMQLAPQTTIPACAAMLLRRSVSGGSPGGSSSPLAKTTTPRAPQRAASSICPSSCWLPTPSSTRSGTKGSSSSPGKQEMPSTSSYLGLTAATWPEKPPMMSCFTIWLPGVSNFGLAPTTATERASSMARRASFAATVLSAVAQREPFLYALPAPVAPYLPHTVIRRDGAHPTTAVGGRRGLVETPNRSPVVRVTGGWPHVEELLGRELAMEDVAPDEPEVLLHVVGPYHLAVQYRLLQVRRQLAVAVDHTIRISLELLPVGLLGPLVRDPLRKERHDVVPLGAERTVEHRGNNAVGERPARRHPAPGVLESLLYVVDGVGQLYSPAKVFPPTRVGGEIR